MIARVDNLIPLLKRVTYLMLGIISLILVVSRDDAQNKMLALKEKAEKELTQYNMELKELIRVIDHDRKLREFMSRKDQERTEAHEQMELAKKRKEAEKSSDREKTVMVRRNRERGRGGGGGGERGNQGIKEC